MVHTTASSGQLDQNLFSFTDPESGTQFLVDIGAAVSIFPASDADTDAHTASTSILSAANGTPIETFGTRLIRLTIGLFSRSWPFILARVTRPILGADFLRSSGFLVDIRRKRLVQAESWDTTELQPATDARQVFHLQQPDGEIPRVDTGQLPRHPRAQILGANGKARDRPADPHDRQAGFRQGQTPSPRQTRRSQGCVQRYVPGRNSPQVQERLVLPAPHGAQGGWHLASMRRFSPPQ